MREINSIVTQMNVHSLKYDQITAIMFRLAKVVDMIVAIEVVDEATNRERERCAKLVSGNYGWAEGKGDYYGDLADLIRGVSDGESEG